MPFRTNEAAQVEMTAFAAGAGPPAKRIATRRNFRSVDVGVVMVFDQQGKPPVADVATARWFGSQITQGRA